MIRRIDSPAGRFYQEIDEQNKVLREGRSVTEILGETKAFGIGLQKYFGARGYEGAIEYRNERALIGTALHVAIRKYLQGEKVNTTSVLTWDEWMEPGVDVVVDPFNVAGKTCDWTREMVTMFQGAVAWCETNILEVLACEQPVLSSDPGVPVGGTIDLVCTTKEGLTILDWKTSSQIDEDHEIQVACYARLLNNADVERVGIGRLYSWKKEPSIQERWLKPDVRKIRQEQFYHRFQAWRLGGGVTTYTPEEPMPRVFQSERFGKKVEVVA